MKKITVFDLALCLLSLALCFGTVFVFTACGPKEDGSWMLCHWADRTVVALAAAFLAASVIRFFVSKDVKKGISIAFIPFSVITLLIPGKIIRLCMMHDMRCWTLMKPFVTVTAVLILAVSIAEVIVRGIKK